MPARTFSFEVNRRSSASATELFRLETDGELWSSWARPLVPQSGWERHGDPAPGGVGAVRKVGLWPLLLREETVEYEQDRRHVYTFAGPPAPAKDYRAEVLFTPNAEGGTDIRWSGTFVEGLPGTGPATLVLLRTAIIFLAARLARAAERA
ncbi:SRPBCC family protein [Amycolatopsis palatopharyngis]|uniref:SRPBCC family protein n=1 Tax=Amycolatopsis palatopharyngis TaxID=187982 RepID=UPI000E250CC3|nr:SRPBCC family protein [Amycolatopsis palatopharyngis]